MPTLNFRNNHFKLPGQINPPAKSEAPAVAKSISPNALTTWAHMLVLAANNTPTQFFPKRVPAGQVVRVRANNGTNANNQNVIFVASYPGAFASGHATPLSPLDDLMFPTDNTGNIWVYGQTGDGIVVSILTPSGS